MIKKSLNEVTESSTKVRITGVSLPDKIVTSIDDQRGDVSRSKYILRIIEKVLPSEDCSLAEDREKGD